jgi:hypothetical protein
MEGPFQIHRRLTPVVNALIQAGYTVKWSQRWSGSETDYLHPMQSGVIQIWGFRQLWKWRQSRVVFR